MKTVKQFMNCVGWAVPNKTIIRFFLFSHLFLTKVLREITPQQLIYDMHFR